MSRRSTFDPWEFVLRKRVFYEGSVDFDVRSVDSYDDGAND